MVLPTGGNPRVLHILQEHRGRAAPIFPWLRLGFFGPEALQRPHVPDVQRPALHAPDRCVRCLGSGRVEAGVAEVPRAVQGWPQQRVYEHQDCSRVDSQRCVACTGCLLGALHRHVQRQRHALRRQGQRYLAGWVGGLLAGDARSEQRRPAGDVLPQLVNDPRHLVSAPVLVHGAWLALRLCHGIRDHHRVAWLHSTDVRQPHVLSCRHHKSCPSPLRRHLRQGPEAELFPNGAAQGAGQNLVRASQESLVSVVVLGMQVEVPRWSMISAWAEPLHLEAVKVEGCRGCAATGGRRSVVASGGWAIARKCRGT
mmetsp:Transcript_4981/g.12840  ORF Transcript_4981/g.12840 Transcript_4981/m.12840 type:complete len:312 (-) Transcript_4981:328-1263(-)